MGSARKYLEAKGNRQKAKEDAAKGTEISFDFGPPTSLNKDNFISHHTLDRTKLPMPFRFGSLRPTCQSIKGQGLHDSTRPRKRDTN